MDPIKKEVLEMWQTHPRGTLLVVSGTLLLSSILPPFANVAVGAIGIAWVVLRAPPDQDGLLARFTKVII